MGRYPLTWTIDLTFCRFDGDTLTGLVTVESDTSVVLRQANGLETTLLRSNLATLRGLGQSAMPEGLEEGLSDQALADLVGLGESFRIAGVVSIGYPAEREAPRRRRPAAELTHWVE